MKKGWILGIVALVVVAMGASFALAATPQGHGMDMTKMAESHQQMIAQHVEDGILTPEQAKNMNEHMSQMDSMMKGGMMGEHESGMMRQDMMKNDLHQ